MVAYRSLKQYEISSSQPLKWSLVRGYIGRRLQEVLAIATCLGTFWYFKNVTLTRDGRTGEVQLYFLYMIEKVFAQKVATEAAYIIT